MALVKGLKNKEAEDQWLEVREVIDAYPFDGAVSFMSAARELFGEVKPKVLNSIFGKVYPTSLGVETGVGKTTNVIWGAMAVQGLEGHISTGWAKKEGRFIFNIGGQIRPHERPAIDKLVALTRKKLEAGSIYKGKAIRLRTNGAGEIDHSEFPRFIDTTQISTSDLFFSDVIKKQIETTIFTPIEHTQICQSFGVPLKRGILLAGPYGTGKTLTAYVTAKKCEENGWTFIMVDRVSGLRETLAIARQYGPAVVFAEDIDREVAGDDRTVRIDDVLNTIDGIESKGSNTITILTSNHIETLNRAMLRPGRIDSVIHVHAPDAAAAIKLVRNYARGLVNDYTDLVPVGERLAGVIPAVIREVVERAKLTAIQRFGRNLNSLYAEDFLVEIEGMQAHLKLMSEPVVVKPSPEEAFGRAFVNLMGRSLDCYKASLNDTEEW